MYLSQLTLNPTHPQARRDLASAYEMHRSLVRAFAAGDGDTPGRFLWRLERGTAGAREAMVLVQAAQPGRWQALSERSGYLLRLQPDKPVATDRLVRLGEPCRFRLLANPNVKRDGKRHGLKDDVERQAWLRRQGERHGFDLLAADCNGRERLRVGQGSRDRLITLDAVCFEGILQPTDAAALAQALLVGIGPGKALGLGMLSLARIQMLSALPSLPARQTAAAVS